MGEGSDRAVRKRAKPAADRSAKNLTVEGEVATSISKDGIEVNGKTERCVFDCPFSVHGIDETTKFAGAVTYMQRISRKLRNGDLWATIEFGLVAPCAVTHYAQARKWIKRAVDDTLDEEHEELINNDSEQEEAQD